MNITISTGIFIILATKDIKDLQKIENRLTDTFSNANAIINNFGYNHSIHKNSNDIFIEITNKNELPAPDIRKFYALFSLVTDILAEIQNTLIIFDKISIYGAIAVGEMQIAKTSATAMLANNGTYPRVMLDDSAWKIVNDAIDKFTEDVCMKNESAWGMLPTPKNDEGKIKLDADDIHFINYFNISVFDMCTKLAIKDIPTFVQLHKASILAIQSLDTWLKDYHNSIVKNELKEKLTGQSVSTFLVP